jgi:ABC-type multidrug transport system fused ATPase/permease subunit
MLAYDYPVLGAFWTLLWIVLWVIWLFLLFRVVFDIFRSDDLSGWGKALWLIFVILLPYLGVFVYIIARGRGMGDRDMRQARARQESFEAYVRDATASGGTADELSKLADLRERGVISDAEFEQQKAKLLA